MATTPGPGARLIAYLVGTGTSSTQRIFSSSVPTDTPGATIGYLIAQRQAFLAIAPVQPIHNGSAIAEALRVAEAETRDPQRSRRFIVVSDLRQYTAHRWNFERQVPEEGQFVRGLRRDGMWPDLSGSEVNVCGFPFKPDVETAEKLRGTWMAALKQMGSRAPVVALDCLSIEGAEAWMRAN